MFLQQPTENILQAYPVQQETEQHRPIYNPDQNNELVFPPNPDIVQSIEVHSLDDPVIAAPSQQIREDNRVDETVIHNDTVKINDKENVLNGSNNTEVERLKREASNEEVTNTQQMNKYKTKNKLKQRKTFHNQAYKFSKLSNGYKNKINPRIPPLETRPSGTIRVPRTATRFAGKYEELTENNSEKMQSGGVGKVTDLAELHDDQAGQNSIVIRSIPQDRYNIKTYQVHELFDEGPNQDSGITEFSISNNTRQVQNRMRTLHKKGEEMDSTGIDKKSEENTRSLTDDPSSYLLKHDGNGEDVTNTSGIVQDEQHYSKLERSASHVNRQDIVDTNPSYRQGQITSRRNSDSHDIRLKHHSVENNNNGEKTTEDEKQSDLNSKMNGSNKLRKQMENRELLQNDDNLDEYSRPGFQLNEEQEEKELKQREHETAFNETGETPLSSVAVSDTFSISPERDMSLSKIPDNEELQMEQITGYDRREYGNKDGYESDTEESVTSSEQNKEQKESHETLQTKPVIQNHSSQNKEHSQHNLEDGDKEATRDKDEQEEEEEEGGGIYEAISKILQKKDAISRAEDVVIRQDDNNRNKKQADSYRNYWVLEYSHPKFRN